MTSDELIANISREILNPFIAMLFAIALVLFFWGLMNFLYNSGDDTSKKQGKSHMLWGLIGMFIMLSVFGILSLFTETLGVVLPT